MVGQKKWRIDIKWIVILAIVAFLLIFEVFPLFYLLIKSLFSGGSFSWEAYRRVYTYDLNWIALKNTIITSIQKILKKLEEYGFPNLKNPKCKITFPIE